MIRSTHIAAIFLAGLIALTAQSAAIARTMPDPTGQMVLCTGTGPVMVYFDETGEPTAPPHLCADFALSLIVALGAADGVLVPMGEWRGLQVVDWAKHSATLQLGTQNARGPPVLMLH